MANHSSVATNPSIKLSSVLVCIRWNAASASIHKSLSHGKSAWLTRLLLHGAFQYFGEKFYVLSTLSLSSALRTWNLRWITIEQKILINQMYNSSCKLRCWKDTINGQIEMTFWTWVLVLLSGIKMMTLHMDTDVSLMAIYNIQCRNPKNNVVDNRENVMV